MSGQRYRGRPGYSANHFRMLNPPKDTQSDVDSRIKIKAAWERAHQEMSVRFPVLTPENAQEAIEFQAELAKKYGGV